MNHYEVTYKVTQDSTTEQAEWVVASNGKKALKAFSAKQPDIPIEQVQSVNLATEEKRQAARKQENPTASTRERHALPQQSPTLGIVGIIIAAGGIYFLFLDAGLTTEVGEIANMHKLFIGQTLMIIGSIFIAVQWRPRE